MYLGRQSKRVQPTRPEQQRRDVKIHNTCRATTSCIKQYDPHAGRQFPTTNRAQSFATHGSRASRAETLGRSFFDRATRPSNMNSVGTTSTGSEIRPSRAIAPGEAPNTSPQATHSSEALKLLFRLRDHRWFPRGCHRPALFSPRFWGLHKTTKIDRKNEAKRASLDLQCHEGNRPTCG